MTFAEMVNAFDDANKDFSTFVEKCNLFVEMTNQELLQNREAIDIKVIEESGNAEDSEKLNNAATEGALVKIKKSIDTLVAKFKEMISKIVKAVVEFFTSKTTEETLKKADDTIKSNPNLKDKTVEIPNNDGVIKAYSEGINTIEKKIAEVKAGKSVTEKEVDEILAKTDEKVKKAKAVKTTVKIAGLATVAGFLVKFIKDESEKDVKTAEEVCDIKTDDTPADVNAKFKLVNAFTVLSNKKFMYAEASLKNTIETIRGTFTKMKPTPLPDVDGIKPEKEVKESTSVELTEEEKTEIVNEVISDIEESVNTEIPEDLSEEEQKEVDDFNKSVKESSDDVVTAEEYLDILESTIEDDIEMIEESAYLEDMEKELFEESSDEEEVSEESVNDDECVTAEEYLESLESEVITAENYLEFIESTIETEIPEDLSEEEQKEVDDFNKSVKESSDDVVTAEEYLDVLESTIEESDETSSKFIDLDMLESEMIDNTPVEEFTEGVAKDAKKVFFLKTEKQFDKVKENITLLKDKKSELTYEEKMDLADEALEIINVLLAEVESIPDDDFLDTVTSIKTYLNALKSIFNFVFKYLLVQAISGGDVSFFSFKRYIDPAKQKGEAVNAIRKLQKEVNKQIIIGEKELRKAEKEKQKAETVKESTIEEIVDSLINEL